LTTGATLNQQCRLAIAIAKVQRRAVRIGLALGVTVAQAAGADVRSAALTAIDGVVRASHRGWPVYDAIFALGEVRDRLEER
jgi:hypothetical protein